MRTSPTLAKDLMRTDVVTVRHDDPVEDVLDLLVAARLHGAPVVDGDGALVGMISQQDVFFGAMTQNRREGTAAGPAPGPLKVAEIMTSPAVSATEDTEIRHLCETMFNLRLHRVPIVRAGRVVGIFSSLDLCGALARGQRIS